MNKALGLIEALGLTTAVTALDAASKAADITLVGFEKIIGVGKAVGVNIQIAGEVAAVQAAVEAAVSAGNKVGVIFASHVIPRPHDEVDALIAKFAKNIGSKEEKKEVKKSAKQENKKEENKK
ncbi:BMC domain-containing protein [Tissierella sp. MB52-C2]|uniref:BMC domain-containing protein n=1 Tax=Tissierella sp. MB52-C2 TaxID=3070999 RepID=UPI00280ADA41|nr:BMC domain-containing protein [Tissierella sp. MB52-C2]WMM25343.1 BMC domain-containing protein [Tissierella sp. MB52-C2]